MSNADLETRLVFQDDETRIQLIESEDKNFAGFKIPISRGILKQDGKQFTAMLPRTALDVFANAWLLSRKLGHMTDKDSRILCFRALDFRDRFPQPVESYREALELLQSDSAYLPEFHSRIVCYLKNGSQLEIPDSFHICQVPKFNSRYEAEKWILDRDEDIKKSARFKLRGSLIANPDLPIDEQIEQALNHRENKVIESSMNHEVCLKVQRWLLHTINAL